MNTKGLTLIELSLAVALFGLLVYVLNPNAIISQFLSGSERIQSASESRAFFLRMEKVIERSPQVIFAYSNEIHLADADSTYKFYSAFMDDSTSVLIQKNDEAAVPLVIDVSEFLIEYFNQESEPSDQLDDIRRVRVTIMKQDGASLSTHHYSYTLEESLVEMSTP